MINRILMELYDDYIENNNLNRLTEFAEKTFADEDAKNLFIGATIILFSRCNGFKARYDATRENLLDIVCSAKKKIGKTNLLKFYVVRLNQTKNVVAQFNNLKTEEAFDNGANIVIEYLEQFKPNFIKQIESYENKIKEFEQSYN